MIEQNGWNLDLNLKYQKICFCSTYSQVNHEVLALERFLPFYHQREEVMGLVVLQEECSLNGSFLFQGI